MAEVFHGRWRLDVIQNEAAFSERFVISGAVSGNGTYPGVVGAPPVTVDGQVWQIRFEWSDLLNPGWNVSQVRRNDAAVTDEEGLIVIIGVDDNKEALRDHDFNDVLLKCICLDVETNGMVAPFHPTLDFSLPEGVHNHS